MEEEGGLRELEKRRRAGARAARSQTVKRALQRAKDARAKQRKRTRSEPVWEERASRERK